MTVTLVESEGSKKDKRKKYNICSLDETISAAVNTSEELCDQSPWQTARSQTAAALRNG